MPSPRVPARSIRPAPSTTERQRGVQLNEAATSPIEYVALRALVDGLGDNRQEVDDALAQFRCDGRGLVDRSADGDEEGLLLHPPPCVDQDGSSAGGLWVRLPTTERAR